MKNLKNQIDNSINQINNSIHNKIKQLHILQKELNELKELKKNNETIEEKEEEFLSITFKKNSEDGVTLCQQDENISNTFKLIGWLKEYNRAIVIDTKVFNIYQSE